MKFGSARRTSSETGAMCLIEYQVDKQEFREVSAYQKVLLGLLLLFCRMYQFLLESQLSGGTQRLPQTLLVKPLEAIALPSDI